MGEMIERVARAIYESRNGAGCWPWSRQNAAYQKPYLHDARAAIEAMRIPTQRMRAQGQGMPTAGVTFTAMIDAALSEDET